MAAVFSEDDRNYFSKFTNARKAPTISDDMLVDVHNVLSNKEFSHSTRLAAAKILIQSGNATVGVNTHHPAVDWVILTAMLETADTVRTIEIVKAWMVYFEKKRVCDNEDETLFLASLSRVLSKRGALIAENCTPKVVKLLHRYLLLAFINLSELECGAKSFEGAVQFVAKSAPHEELFDFCLNEIDSRLRGKYGILKIFFRDVTLPREEQECEPIVERICGQLTKLLDCQLITNAAADLVATLVVMFPSSKNLLRLIAQNMVHHMKCIRSNTLRWIGRFEVVRKSHDFLLSLQSSLYDSFLSLEEDIWPPQLWETEDVSCVDPVWDSDEAEDVLWKADRTLEAYLNVTSTLCQRYRHELDWNNPVIHAALKWHLPEIRLSAFQLWTAHMGKDRHLDENSNFLEEFILNNGSSTLTSLRRAVEDASNSCTMSPEGQRKWQEIVNRNREQEKLDEEQRGTSYLPEDLNISEILPLPAAEEAKTRLEEALRVSGSDHPKACPAFPELYSNLSKAGYDQRVFARYIIDLMNLIKSNDDVKSAVEVISDAVTRCRLKVVVDHGCSLVDELLSEQHFDEHFFYLVEYRYCWAMNHLIDETTECRTLPLARILWSVCEKSKDLLKIFFESCRATLEGAKVHANVHQRVLKTLKLFASKADCKMPNDFVEFLFWHCVDAQEHCDFLVRSAATILFGFVVRYITKSRVVPAFYVLSTRAKFWNETLRRAIALPTLPSRQRVLLLSFLSRLTLGHMECYPSSVQLEIRSLLESLIELLRQTSDIRQRRFCLEILLAMSSASAHSELLRELDELAKEHDLTSQSDVAFLRYYTTILHGADDREDARRIPTDLLQSKFVRLIEKCSTVDPEETLKETEAMLSTVESHSGELTTQAIAMALVQVATKLRTTGSADSAIRRTLVSQCRALLSHKWCSPRAVSILSRVPASLGLTKYFYQKCYVLEILDEWESESVS